MPTIISTAAQEESTFIFSCAFTDENGDAVTPDSITWTLTDSSGTVINSLEDVAVATPASSVDIVLSGDDLAIQSGETASQVARRLLVEAVIDSDTGSDLPVKASALFVIENLMAVT